MGILLDHQGRAFEVPAPTDHGPGRVEHADRWVNPLTGIGSVLDKTVHGRFMPVWRLWDPEITDLYNGSDIAAKIVEKRNREMFRRGFELEMVDVEKTAIEDFREWATETFQVEMNLREGRKWGGAYGGTLLVLGVDDGRDQSEPLDEERIRSVRFINQVDRRFAYAESWYSALDQPKYGQPETYLISSGVATTGWSRRSPDELRKSGAKIGRVHESRVIRFDGNPADVTTQQLLAGWSWSVLQRPYDVIRQFDHTFDAAAYLLSDASQGVFKLQGLVRAMTGGNKSALEQRVQIMEENRSVLRGIALDAGGPDGKNAEEFTRTATPFTGIPDMLDRLMQRLAAAADMPTTELFGQGGGGLNAAGEAENSTRKWYDTIASDQTDYLSPSIKRLFRILALSKDSPLKPKKSSRGPRWKVKFNPLWAPSDKELAETRLTDAQRDQIYISEGVVTPEVVSMTVTELYPALDAEAIEESIQGAKAFDPYENDPDPEPPPAMPGAEGATPGVPIVPGAAPAPAKGKAPPAAKPAPAAAKVAATKAKPKP